MSVRGACAGAWVMMWMSFAPCYAADEDAQLTSRQAQGKALFEQTCNYCHAERMWGARTLAKRQGEARALLMNRTDLQVEYIRHVIRHGLNSMPWYTRTDLSDGEVTAIADYLTRKRS